MSKQRSKPESSGGGVNTILVVVTALLALACAGLAYYAFVAKTEKTPTARLNARCGSFSS